MNRIVLGAAIALLCMPSCRYHNGRRVHGNGRMTTEQRNISGFTAVNADGSVDVVVSKGPYQVTVKGDDNVMQYVVTEVTGGQLSVHFKSSVSFIDFDDVTVYVSAPDINEFVCHGSGNITGQGRLSDSGKIIINVFGSGDIQLDVDGPSVVSEIHGSGDITLAGETKDVSCAIYGSGDFKASSLKAENAHVSIHGSGDAEVYASESLDAEIAASGDVHYRGEPKVTSSVHGSGEVSRMN